MTRATLLLVLLAPACRDEAGTCDDAPPRSGCIGPTDCARDVRDATCTGPIWQCDPIDGEWREIGSCEPETMAVTGEVTLSLQHAELPAGCPPGLAPRESLVVDADDSGLRFTATAPAVVVSDVLDSEVRPAELLMSVDDVWSHDAGELPVRLLFLLDLEDDGSITGGGGTQVTDDCPLQYAVVGSFTPTWRLER
jgi:hypothetical protein